jgi:hypothetical protein
MSQPHFEKNVKMKLTLPKWELGSLPGLPKLQSSIAGVKTPHIEAFFISLESYRSIDHRITSRYHPEVDGLIECVV